MEIIKNMKIIETMGIAEIMETTEMAEIIETTKIMKTMETTRVWCDLDQSTPPMISVIVF